jgi:hypothetical protein
MPVDLGQQDGELVAAEAGDGVGAAQRAGEPPGDLDQQRVAAAVAQGVVDVLEPVQVDQQQSDRGSGGRSCGQGLGEPVGQQRPVGQPGQRVVVGLVLQPAFHGGAVGDVPAGQHQSGDVRFVAKVEDGAFQLAPAAGAVADPEQQRLAAAGPGSDPGQRLVQPGLILGVQQLIEAGAGQPCGGSAEHCRHRPVAGHHGAGLVQHGDHVAGCFDQDPEPGLGRQPGPQLGGVQSRVAGAAQPGEQVGDDQPDADEEHAPADPVAGGLRCPRAGVGREQRPGDEHRGAGGDRRSAPAEPQPRPHDRQVEPVRGDVRRPAQGDTEQPARGQPGGDQRDACRRTAAEHGQQVLPAAARGRGVTVG